MLEFGPHGSKPPPTTCNHLCTNRVWLRKLLAMEGDASCHRGADYDHVGVDPSRK